MSTCIQYMDQLFPVYLGLLICIFTCKKWCNHPTFSLSKCSLTWTQRSWLSCRNTCHLTTTRTMKLQPKPSHYGMAQWCKVTSPFLGGYKFCHLSNFGAQNFLQPDSSLCFLFTDTRTKQSILQTMIPLEGRIMLLLDVNFHNRWQFLYTAERSPVLLLPYGFRTILSFIFIEESGDFFLLYRKIAEIMKMLLQRWIRTCKGDNYINDEKNK